MTQTTTYPLRLPHSLKAALTEIAKEEGTSVNQFITLAVAEKLSAIRTQEFFMQRRDKADFAAFDRIMHRQGGEPPRHEDEPINRTP